MLYSHTLNVTLLPPSSLSSLPWPVHPMASCLTVSSTMCFSMSPQPASCHQDMAQTEFRNRFGDVNCLPIFKQGWKIHIFPARNLHFPMIFHDFPIKTIKTSIFRWKMSQFRRLKALQDRLPGRRTQLAVQLALFARQEARLVGEVTGNQHGVC